jgi:hypothetical protein
MHASTYAIGAAVSLSVTVAPDTPSSATPTGTITFSDSNTGTVLGTAAVSNGSATIRLSNLGRGSYAITAAYSGDANFSASTSAGQSLTITQATTNTVTSASLANVTAQQPTTLAAQVLSNGATPTGTVTFLDGTQPLGTATLAKGSASLTNVILSLGYHNVTAAYSGDAGSSPSTSPVETVAAESPTITTITSTNGTFVYGLAGAIAVHVTNTLPGLPAPSGSVLLYEKNIVLGTADANNGTAMFTVSLSPGTHSIGARYDGGGLSSFSGVASEYALYVNRAPTQVTFTHVPNAPYSSAASTFNVIVAPGADGVVPTGNVELIDDTEEEDIRSLTNGEATLMSYANFGDHVFTVRYLGDTVHAPSNSPNSYEEQLAKQSTSITLTEKQVDRAIMFTAQFPQGVPDNEPVYFQEDGTTIGTGFTATTSDATDVADTVFSATFTTNSLSQGTHTITAVYAGDLDYSASTSSPIAVAVNPVPVIDLLAVYTSAAANAAGGSQQIEDLIAATVEQTNQAFANSQINASIRLVDVQQVSYAESGNIDTDMNRLQNGRVATVSALRQQYGADLVTMFTSAGTQAGNEEILGEGDVLRNVGQLGGNDSLAYSVVVAPSALANYTLAHELGHNLGAMHDTQNADGTGAYAYSYGWRFTGNDGTTYHDIMSYDPGQVIPYYSNPDVNYDGVPTGTAGADNALTINQTAAIVAGYRASVVPEATISTAITLNHNISSSQPDLEGQSLLFTFQVSPAAATGTVTIKEGSTVLGEAGINQVGAGRFFTSALAAGVHQITAVYSAAGDYSGSVSAPVQVTVMQHNADDNLAYIQELYHDLFHRDVDPTGQAAWMAMLANGGTFHDVAMGIVGSREYDGDIVDGFYVQYLGRHAETAGLNAWVDLMQSGLNADQIRAGILGSDEYFTDVGGTTSAFLTALYEQFLGRGTDPTGLAYWTSLLGNNDSKSRAAVSSGIANSDETRTDLIDSYYETYLHRSPDAPGLAVWMQNLADGVSEPVIVAAFLTSPEYLGDLGIS